MRLLPLLLLLVACQERMTGYDPATNRCREFKDGKFVGDFLKDEDCAGKLRPNEIPEEAAPNTLP